MERPKELVILTILCILFGVFLYFVGESFDIKPVQAGGSASGTIKFMGKFESGRHEGLVYRFVDPETNQACYMFVWASGSISCPK